MDNKTVNNGEDIKIYTNKDMIKCVENDTVNHPDHYTQGNIECIEAIEACMDSDSFMGYLKGNVMKYVWRYDQKNGITDLRKALVYLKWMIEYIEGTH